MIPFVLTEFDETRDVRCYLEVSDVRFYNFPDYPDFVVTGLCVSYERHISDSWRPVCVRFDGAENSVVVRWPDSHIPPWACEFVENYWPRPKGMTSIASDRIRDKLVAE